MRFPDIHQDKIVFVYGEDIWSVNATGGIAQRLTIHDGEEHFPRFSPDGSLIAFTGYYDGNGDIYVMNAYGGEITRVTWHPGYEEVVGWHPVKNKIIYRAYGGDYPGFTRLFLISPDGTGTEELILHESGNGCFSPDGSKIVYTKVSTENRTWKRYRGGLAPDLYIYDFKTNEDKNLSNFEGTDGLPMWIGDMIYFNSDRNKGLNLWQIDPKTMEMKQLTFHADYEVRRPSEGSNKIVYELGGKLMVFDVAAQTTTEVPVQIRTDAPEVRPYLKDVKEFITDIDCSPAGERALIVARGEIFTVPAQEGPTRNLTQSSGARDKDALWSPDGKQIAWFSDKTGEYELYIIDQKGETETVKLTTHKDGYRHSLKWSPDSKKIAFTDQTLTLSILDIATKQITVADKAAFENIDVSIDLKPIYDFNWSPDSRFIAYSKRDADLVNKIYIYSLETKEIHCLSTIYNDFHPVFSPCGDYLSFISNRRFDPTFCDLEWEMVYKNIAGIYCLTLRKDGAPLFPFESDEAFKEEATSGESNEETDHSVVIDFDGLYSRIEALPVEAGNYRYLSVSGEGLFYLNKDEGDFNEFEFRVPESMDLYRFSFEDQEEAKVIEGIRRYRLSADGKKIVYQKRDNVGIIPASATDSKGENLDLSGLKMWLDPKAEWKQIFLEAWRMERDYYYEPNMHGIDWDVMKERYGRLIDDASCRQDVVFIIGELIGELNTSHTYVYGGDIQREADRVSVGMLGADYEVDMTANRYKFKRILRNEDWSREIYPPLERPGITVDEGDYLLKVNNTEIFADRNIYSYFQDLANKQVTITINSKPSLEGARTYVVKLVGSEGGLRYMAWVEHNRQVVDEASDGEIGYMHFPDTYDGTAVQFPTYFFSQTQKKGLIIDGRFNGGGLDPVIFLSRLMKAPHSYWTRRYSHDQTSPSYSTTAHMVCLTNRQAGSGGDELPFEFRQFNMGPVIGTRTWGGLVGVSMFIPLIDGGGMTAPDYRIYGPDGKWVVENVGVTPDIVIDLHPAEVAKGYDAQLMKGVEVLLQKIKDEPRPWPQHEAFPVDK
jgi:tricorn protease